MIRFDYAELINNMPFPVTVFQEYQDNPFINFFADDNKKYQSINVEERDDLLILWFNSFNIVSYDYLYGILIKIIPFFILFPYIESKEELDAVIRLGVIKVDFHEDEQHYQNNIYGSYIIEKKLRK